MAAARQSTAATIRRGKRAMASRKRAIPESCAPRRAKAMEITPRKAEMASQYVIDQNRDSNGDAVSDELVADHGMDKQREQSKHNRLRQNDDVKLLGVLQRFKLVVTRN